MHGTSTAAGGVDAVRGSRDPRARRSDTVSRQAHAPQPNRRSTRRKAPRTAPAPRAADTPAAGNAKDLYRQGLLSMMRGDSKGAVAAFKAALQKNSKFSLAYRGLGLAYQRMNQRAQARTAFRRYLIMTPNAPDTESIQRRIKSLE